MTKITRNLIKVFTRILIGTIANKRPITYCKTVTRHIKAARVQMATTWTPLLPPLSSVAAAMTTWNKAFDLASSIYCGRIVVSCTSVINGQIKKKRKRPRSRTIIKKTTLHASAPLVRCYVAICHHQYRCDCCLVHQWYHHNEETDCDQSFPLGTWA